MAGCWSCHRRARALGHLEERALEVAGGSEGRARPAEHIAAQPAVVLAAERGEVPAARLGAGNVKLWGCLDIPAE